MTQTIQSHGNSVQQLISSQKADKDKSLSAFSSILDTPELKNLYLFQIGDKLDSVRTVAYVGPYISRDYLYSQVGDKVYPLVHDMDTFRDNPDTICIVYDDGLRNFFATSLDRAIKEYSKGTTASILDTPGVNYPDIGEYWYKKDSPALLYMIRYVGLVRNVPSQYSAWVQYKKDLNSFIVLAQAGRERHVFTVDVFLNLFLRYGTITTASILDTPELKNPIEIGAKYKTLNDDSAYTVLGVGPIKEFPMFGVHKFNWEDESESLYYELSVKQQRNAIVVYFKASYTNQTWFDMLEVFLNKYTKVAKTASILDTPELRDFYSINPYELKVGDTIGNDRKILYVGPYISEAYIKQQTHQQHIWDNIAGDYLRAHPETMCVVYINEDINEAHVFELDFVLQQWKDMIKRASILDSISPVANTFQEFIDMAKPWQVWKSLSPKPSDDRIYLLIGENATFNIFKNHMSMRDVVWVNQFNLDNGSTKPNGDWEMRKGDFPMELLPQEWDTSHISSILDTPELRFPVQIGELWKFKSIPNCIIKITWIGEWKDHPSQDYYQNMGNDEFADDDICIRSRDIESSGSYYTDSLSDFLLIHVPVDSSDKVSSILELPEFNGVYSEFAGLSVGDVVNINSLIPFKISFIGRFDAIPKDMNIQYDFKDSGFIPLNKTSDIIVVYQDNRQGENATYWYGEIFQFIKHYKPVIQSHAAISSMSAVDSGMIVKDNSTTAINAKMTAKSATVVSSDSKSSSILELPEFSGDLYPYEGEIWEDKDAAYPFKYEIVYVGLFSNHPEPDAIGPMASNFKDTCVRIKRLSNNGTGTYAINDFLRLFKRINFNTTSSILESIPPDEYQGIAVGDEYKDRDFTIRKVLYIGPFVSLTHLNQYLPVHMTFLFFSATPTDIVVGYKTDTGNCFVMKLNKFMRVVNTSTRTASVNPNLIKDDQLRYI